MQSVESSGAAAGGGRTSSPTRAISLLVSFGAYFVNSSFFSAWCSAIDRLYCTCSFAMYCVGGSTSGSLISAWKRPSRRVYTRRPVRGRSGGRADCDVVGRE